MTNIGPYITCSIGFAANRQLAKIACKQNKPDGITIWHPHDLPHALHPIPFKDITGIGAGMEKRLYRLGIYTMAQLLALSPKHMRKIWRNVTGERLWYTFHGYAIHAPQHKRAMFGHGRVISPKDRSRDNVKPIARMLLVKATKAHAQAEFLAQRLFIWCDYQSHGEKQRYKNSINLHFVQDDKACLDGLELLWRAMCRHIMASHHIKKIGVALGELAPVHERQLDLLYNDETKRHKWENVTCAIDDLNRRYSKSLITLGEWRPPEGGNAGGKIAFTRIPEAEDFW